MSTANPVLLILGSGSNVGHHVAQAFTAKGYKVALTSRKAKERDDTPDRVNISADLSDPESIAGVFSNVKASLGAPSVVVYNAGAASPNDKKNPLSLPVSDFTRDLNINTISLFAAAQQAASAFEQLPDSASKTFIYTGNVLNTTTMAGLMTLGVGKTAAAHVIETAALAYTDRGWKFYYADERKSDGAPAYLDIDGEAHAKQYVALAEAQSQGPWLQTFVKGVGYKSFV